MPNIKGICLLTYPQVCLHTGPRSCRPFGLHRRDDLQPGSGKAMLDSEPAPSARERHMKVVAMKLRQIMRADPLRIEASETVQRAAGRMAAAAIPAALVIENGHLVGVLANRDISQKVVAKLLDPALTPVSDIMSPDPVRICDDREVESAILVMRARRVQELVVQDFAGKLIGIVCGCDLCNGQWEDA